MVPGTFFMGPSGEKGARHLFRVGCIDFLNSLPVYYAIERKHVACPATLVKAAPAELNHWLVEGKLAVSPISSIEFARHASELALIPNLSISSASGACSVILASRLPLEELRGRSIAMSLKGATTPVLLKILLARHFHLDASLVPFAGRWMDALQAHPAAMLIGDDALACATQRPHLTIVDLGEAWQRWTGEPMVFALWAAPQATVRSQPQAVEAVAQALFQSRDWGLAHLDEVIQVATQRSPLDDAFLRRYFTRLQYQLGEREWSGLRRFWDEAQALGELEASSDLAAVVLSARGSRVR